MPRRVKQSSGLLPDHLVQLQLPLTQICWAEMVALKVEEVALSSKDT